jgi:pantoate--beta-alanine ligase
MSSRNAYLQGDDRRAATILYRALSAAKKEIDAGELESGRLIEPMRRVFGTESGAVLDYAEIVDAETLEPVIRLRKSCLALVAAFIGKTRLIDNAQIEASGDGVTAVL